MKLFAITEMEALENKIEVIRENGIGLGLSDMEIDLCMLSVMKELKESQDGNGATRKRTPRRTPRSKRMTWLRACCIGGVGIVLLIWIAFAAIAYSPSNQQWIEKKIEPIFYPMSQRWRLLTLGLAKTFDLTPYHTAECLIRNPFAIEESVPCEDCERITREHEFEDMTPEKFEETYSNKAQPFVVRSSHSVVTFNDLLVWYNENVNNFDQFDVPSKKLTIAPSGLNKITDFFGEYTEDDIRKATNFRMDWVTNAVNPSRHIRRLFSRRSFIPAKSEVNLHKTISVTSPDMEQFAIPRHTDDMSNKWYVQASGSRTLILKPDPLCEQQCNEVRITLNAGDVLFYGMLFWNVESVPEPENGDINIAFIGSFT